MIEFSENFNIFLMISMISFYFNKEFHLQMSFNSNTTNYKITCERFEAKKVNNIIIQMKEFLIFDHQQLKKTKQIIEAQINKHRWDIIYEVNDWNNETTFMQTWIFEEKNNVTNASELNKIKDLILIIIQSMLAS